MNYRLSSSNTIIEEVLGLQPIELFVLYGENFNIYTNNPTIIDTYEFYIFAEVGGISTYKVSNPKKLVVGCPQGDIEITDNAITSMSMEMPGLDWPTEGAYIFDLPTTLIEYCVVQ